MPIERLSAIIDNDAFHTRFLAGASQKDYTVLSVAVLTLGLILVVELIRHQVDHAATGRFFFKTVLDGVYRERKLRCRIGQQQQGSNIAAFRYPLQE